MSAQRKSLTPTAVVYGKSIKCLIENWYRLTVRLRAIAIKRHIKRMTFDQAKQILAVSEARYSEDKYKEQLVEARRCLVTKVLRQPYFAWLMRDRRLGNFGTWMVHLSRDEVEMLIKAIIRSTRPEYAVKLCCIQIHNLPGYDHYPAPLLDGAQRKRLSPLLIQEV